MVYHKTKLACKRKGSLEDRVETVTFLLYKPLLGSSEDTVETVTFFFYYITPHCNLDLAVSTLIIPHNTPSLEDSPDI